MSEIVVFGPTSIDRYNYFTRKVVYLQTKVEFFFNIKMFKIIFSSGSCQIYYLCICVDCSYFPCRFFELSEWNHIVILSTTQISIEVPKQIKPSN